MPFNNPIAGGLDLIREALQSPNFESGVSGWSINKDGNAEFNGVVFRGTLHSRDPETGQTIDIEAGRILIDNDTLNAIIYAEPTQGLLISSNQGITLSCPDGPLTFNAPEIDLTTDTNIEGSLSIHEHSVSSFMDIVGPPSENTEYTSTGGEVTMSDTYIEPQEYLTDHVYRATFQVQYDANESGGVGCSVRFRVRQGENTSGTFLGGHTTPVLTKMYGTFLPTALVVATWRQTSDVTSALILTMERHQQSTGTVVAQMAATDYYASVEDLGHFTFL